MDLPAVAAATTPAADPGGTKAAVDLLQCDEKSGVVLKSHVPFEQVVHKATPLEANWKAWLDGGRLMAATPSDKAAVVSMLDTVHNRWDAFAVDVKTLLLSDRASLVAGATMNKNALM